MEKIIVILGLAIMLTSSKVCAMGLFYTNVTHPVTATGAIIQDFSRLKKGIACANNILYLVETGDASIDSAAKNGGIKKISHIDIEEKSVFIFWRGVKVTVYGE